MNINEIIGKAFKVKGALRSNDDQYIIESAAIPSVTETEFMFCIKGYNDDHFSYLGNITRITKTTIHGYNYLLGTKTALKLSIDHIVFEEKEVSNG